MANKAKTVLIESKREAVIKRFKEMIPSLDVLSKMWDEQTLDTLILAFGIGHVTLNDE